MDWSMKSPNLVDASALFVGHVLGLFIRGFVPTLAVGLVGAALVMWAASANLAVVHTTTVDMGMSGGISIERWRLETRSYPILRGSDDYSKLN